MDITVAEKRVTFRDSYPVAEFAGLRKRIAGLDIDAQWDARAKVLREFVESWEFEGDPQDVGSWGLLDFFHMQAIENAISTEIIQERAQYAKNSDSGPIEE